MDQVGKPTFNLKRQNSLEQDGTTTPQGEHKAEAASQHVPVLLEEALQYLNVRPGGTFVDATLGLGGHSAALARKLGGKGRLICFDRDPAAMAAARMRLDALAAELGSEMPTVIYEPRAFSQAAEAIEKASLDGLLADFGVSSMQLDEAHRGFSFRSEGPLDMRMDLARVVSAAAPSMKGDKIHPATRTFQAIRIHVNDELGEIQA